jgi:hypothetical protein
MNIFRRRHREQRREVGRDGWTCHVCGDYRPDSAISVYSSTIMLAGNIPMQQNVRYCNDRPACQEGAKNVNWIEP